MKLTPSILTASEARFSSDSSDSSDSRFSSGSSMGHRTKRIIEDMREPSITIEK